MTNERLPILTVGAAVITRSPADRDVAYDDGLMMNVSVPEGVALHSQVNSDLAGGTRKTAVGRETTDDE